MLKIIVKSGECYNELTNEFVRLEKDTTIALEHSLVSVSKWESKWHKPFLSSDKKSKEELIDYIKCMTITQNIDEVVYYFMSAENFKCINSYIEDSMSATTINDMRPKVPGKKSEVLTSEVIYYYMIACEIPFECQKWHLNRLLMLIRVCNIKNNANGKKMSKKEILSNNAALNAARKKQLNTRG